MTTASIQLRHWIFRYFNKKYNIFCSLMQCKLAKMATDLESARLLCKISVTNVTVQLLWPHEAHKERI